jgi:myo-inositol-1-phosphate synthase
MVRAPKAVTALAVVLCPDDSSKLPSADFTSAIDILQKVSDMNLKLLFTFDFNLLGSHNGKKLSEFMESSSKVFSTGTAVADWMKMLGLFLTVFDIAVSISIISIM